MTSTTSTLTVATTKFVQSPRKQPSGRGISLQKCYEIQGGVENAGDISLGCGAVLGRIQTCYEQCAPWTDPYDYAQSEGFRECLCETSAGATFTPDSALYKYWNVCAHCLLLARTPNPYFLVQEELRIENFCRSQNPDAFLFIKQLTHWLQGLDFGISLSSPPIPEVTDVVLTLSALYTTTPPLANLAYGTAAPWDGGSLAQVTPSLTTYTTGSETVTSLVTWLPTASGETFNATAASVSAAQELSSVLTHIITTISDMPVSSASTSIRESRSSSSTTGSERCYGRGPCRINAASGVENPLLGLGLVVGFTIVIAVVRI